MACWIETPIEMIVEGVPATGYAPYYFPPTGGSLIFSFTDETFTRILSALRNGAALSYGVEAQQVVWDFLVNVEYPTLICDAVADCFTNDAEFRQSVINALMSDPSFLSQVREGLGAGGSPYPNPNGDLAAGTNPTCDLNILWAQCLAIAMETNAAITDVLEKIEVTSNAVELIDAASDFPLVKWVKDLLGGSVTLSLIQYYQEAIAEQYTAQYTTTSGGVQDQIACAIFCACKADCEITVQRIFDVMKIRLETYITVPTLATIGDLIDFVAGISQDNTTVVDVAFFFAWGGAALGSFLFGEVFDAGIETLLALSVNDASSDWELLCLDCAEPPADPVEIFTAGGQPGGTFERINETDVLFTSAVGGDSVHRVAFQYNNSAPRCVRIQWAVLTGSITAGYNGTYECGANPALDGYTSGLTLEMPPQSECFAGLIFGSTTGAFTISVEFMDNC